MLWLALGCPSPPIVDPCARQGDDDLDGYVAAKDPACLSDDCDDHDASVNPGSIDLRGDHVDQDCDGLDAPNLSITPSEAFARIGLTTPPDARLQLGDVDGNALPDLYLQGQKGGWFIPGIPRSGVGVSHAVAPMAGTIADLDGDGRDELVAWLGADIGVYGPGDPRDLSRPKSEIDCLLDVDWILAGHLDADATTDLLVSTRSRLMVVYGEPGRLPDGDILDHPDFFADDETTPVISGKLADLDGDGLDDLLGSTASTTTLGWDVAILYGQPQRWTGLHSNTAWPRLVAGDQSLDWFGAAFTALDHDGDGYGDPVVSVPFDGEEGAGKVLLLRGGPVPFGATTGPDRAVLTLHGAVARSAFGYDLDGAGDLDGDGADELLVGSATAAYLFSSGQLGRLDVNEAAATFHPEIPGSRFGDFVRALDLDGDAAPEILVGGDDAGVATLYLFGAPL